MKAKRVGFAVIAMVLFSQVTAVAQSFQETILDLRENDYNHSSIARHQSGSTLLGYVVAGTKINRNVIDDNVTDCAITYLKPDGSIAWGVELDFGKVEGCLDVVLKKDEKIIIIGYVGENHFERNVLVAELDVNAGVLLNSREIFPGNFQVSLGMTIDYDPNKDFFAIGGSLMEDFDDTSKPAAGFVMRLDDKFDVVWNRTFVGTSTGLCGANDVLITPSGIFVTGSYGNTVGHGMAAFMLRSRTGSVKWDLSNEPFASSCYHVGTQAMYESVNNGTVYLLSNNSKYHNFQVTRIENANTIGASVVNEYVIDAQSGGSNPLALSFEVSQANNNNFVVSGIFENVSYDVTTGHSPTFLTRFNKLTGSIVSWSKMYEAASSGYSSFGPPALNPFFKPRMYSPSNMVLNDIGGYVFLGHRYYDTSFNSEVFSTDANLQAGYESRCEQIFFTNLVTNITSVPARLNFYDPQSDNYSISGDRNVLPITIAELCPEEGEQKMANIRAAIKADQTAELTIHPNPSNTGQFQLEINGFNEQTQVQVFTVDGKIVMEQNLSNNQTTIDLSGSNQGLYFVKVNDGQHMKTQKIIYQ